MSESSLLSTLSSHAENTIPLLVELRAMIAADDAASG
jgi:hypothetical protein